MRNILPDNQMRAMAMAMAGAVVAAVATMFVPAALFEGLAGSTGLSEILEVAKPPLGDTARAIIAFGTGALTLAVLAFTLLRPERRAPSDADAVAHLESSPLRHLLTKVEMPKMPWAKGEDDITELSDLPKLKNGDSHPDAPPRRPLMAHDLPVIERGENAQADEPASAAAPEMAEPATPVTVPPATPRVADRELQPTLADMVAQLEAAVSDRKQQLAELELVAAQLGAGRSTIKEPIQSSEDQLLKTKKPAVPSPARIDRPSVLPVANSVENPEMDSALASALATLHRMNGSVR